MDPDTWDWLQRLKAPEKIPVFQGQTFLVTGGASGIGEKLCVFAAELGARVATIDISQSIESKFDAHGIIGKACNLADYRNVREIVTSIGRRWGITKVILNAGIFPKPRPEPTRFEMAEFENVMRINTFGNTAVGDASLPFLWDQSNAGKDPLIVVVGSRNLATPSHASYTMAKAALAQYGNYLSHLQSPPGSPHHRVYLEHPDAVFDTNIWGSTPEERQATLEDSAAKKDLTVAEYLDKSNPMGVQFTSWRVAASIVDMALPINRGKHGIGVYNIGGVHIPKPY
jgi:NAD(P)-dependent dehydrogenase (short-subunit alcohol dehydrogenase family)